AGGPDADLLGDDADLGPIGRHSRREADVPARIADLHGRLDPLRLLGDLSAAHPLPRAPEHRRGRPAAELALDREPGLPAAAPRPGDGLLERRRVGWPAPRADAGRLPDRYLQLAR